MANEPATTPQSIDVTGEDVFPLSEGPKKVGKSESRLRYFINSGYHINGDKTLPKRFLASCQLTSGKATSMEAWRRFLIDINTNPNGSDDEEQ